MKHSYRQPWLALSVVIVAAVFVAACQQQPGVENGESPDTGAMRAAPRTTSLEASNVCEEDDPQCVPSGAHAKHPSDCTICHAVPGRLSFRIGGPAFPTGWVNGQTRPSFDAGSKTCSNVACHGVPAGTYAYTFPGNEDLDGDGYADAEYKEVTYGGTMGATTTPSWYATGTATCAACHGNPPAGGSSGSNAWHSGNHANDQFFNVGGGLWLNANQCELCHNVLQGSTYTPIATSVPDGNGGYVATGAALPGYHGNGLNVAPRWRTACFGCH